MGVKLSAEIQTALSDPKTVKIVAGVDAQGGPHAAFKDSLRLRKDGNLEYDEIIESSDANKSMVASIWFDRTVAVVLLTKDHRSFLIKGKAVRAIISGQEFRERYTAVREKLGDVDLSTVWVIEPFFEREDTLEKRRIEEEKAHPLLRHVDRLVQVDRLAQQDKIS
ncbi:MAG: hypothetical protein LBQ42_03540 [Synergistaceae bacterium]|jgi:hypothetical protein|nr:hypothetical protein [Synergistaceae bacterium]